MTPSAILHRITDDPVGLLLTAVALGALWTVWEWAIARADVSSLDGPE